MSPLLLALMLGQTGIAPGGVSCPDGYAVQMVSGNKNPGRCVALSAGGGGGGTPGGVDGDLQVKAGTGLGAFAGSSACSTGSYGTAVSTSGALTCSTAAVASATALASTPSTCTAGHAPRGVDTQGNASGCQTVMTPPTCSAGQHVTCNGTTCSCTADTGGTGYETSGNISSTTLFTTAFTSTQRVFAHGRVYATLNSTPGSVGMQCIASVGITLQTLNVRGGCTSTIAISTTVSNTGGNQSAFNGSCVGPGYASFFWEASMIANGSQSGTYTCSFVGSGTVQGGHYEFHVGT